MAELRELLSDMEEGQRRSAVNGRTGRSSCRGRIGEAEWSRVECRRMCPLSPAAVPDFDIGQEARNDAQ